MWADLGDGVPDGICLDAEGAVWYADVPNKRCVRVREGGEVLQTIELDRGCFACMLGGADGTTLFLIANEWGGAEGMAGSRNGSAADHAGSRAWRRLAPAQFVEGRVSPPSTGANTRASWMLSSYSTSSGTISSTSVTGSSVGSSAASTAMATTA